MIKFETRSQRLARLKHERQLTQNARKLRAAQAGALATLGAKALIPAGKQRSAHLYKR